MATQIAIKEEKLEIFDLPPEYSSRDDIKLEESKPASAAYSLDKHDDINSKNKISLKLSSNKTSTDDEDENADDDNQENGNNNGELNSKRRNSFDDFVKMSSIYSNNNDLKVNSSNSGLSNTPTIASSLFDDVDFKEMPKDMAGKLRKFIKAFEYICHVKEPEKIVNDQKCYEAFFYVKILLSQDDRFIENKNWKFLSKTTMDQIIVNLLVYLSNICDEFDLESIEIASEVAKTETDLNERQISILDYSIILVNKLADIQLKNENLYEFNKNLFDKKVVDALLSFFKREKFLEKLSEHYDPHDKIIGIIATIRNITENPYLDKDAWKQNHTIDILTEFGKKCHFVDTYNEILNEIISNIHQRSLAEFINYLKELDDPSHIIDDKQVYSDIFFIKYMIKNQIFKDYRLFVELECVDLFTKIIKYFHDVLIHSNFESLVIELEKPTNQENINQRRFTIFYYLLVIINEVIFRSIEVNIAFGKIEMVKTLASFLTETYIAKIIMHKNVVLLLIKNLSILSRWADDHKKEWNDLKLIDTFLRIVKKFKADETTPKDNNQEIVISSYYAIGNIADDKQIEKLPEINYVIQKLLKELCSIADLFQKEKAVEKIKIQFMNGEKKIDFLKVSYLNRALTGTLYGLTRFSVNEKTKKTIFNKYAQLKTIIYKGNTIEKTCSLRLLAQLCFDKEIADIVQKDIELIKFLETHCLTHKTKDLKKVAHIILWSINPVPKVNNKNKHIFISSSPTTQDICEKIQQELEKNDFKVWIDHKNNSSKSNIEIATKAIEKSRCVLICICEKYRISEKCQAESQHSLRLKKHIIPLIMQEGFENVDGWLANVVNDTLKINFVKNKFDDCMKKLIEQINLPNMVLSKNVNEWTQAHVFKWLIENKIHQDIVRVYENIDGFTLRQVYIMKCQTPEFFYQSLTKETNHNIKTIDIAYFSGKLEHLFKKA